MDVILEGELTIIPANLTTAYSWTTRDGIEVSIDGGDVRLLWKDPLVPEDLAWRRMEHEIESRLLIETIESGAPHNVRWTLHGTDKPVGRRMSFPFSVGAWTTRRPYVPLSDHDPAPALAGIGSVQRDALDLYREAMELTEEHWDAALTRAFVGVELLVGDLTGSTTRGQWREAGHKTRYGPGKALQLYLSFQSARHSDASLSDAELRRIKRKRLSFGQCLEESGRFIERLVDYRRRHP
jgi:hypothetical protein